MVILAKNEGKGISKYNIFIVILYGVISSFCFLFLIYLSLYSFFTSETNYTGVILILLAVVALSAFVGLSYLDIYLRWERGKETVYVQQETLVIERNGCIFRRRKEIPLSTIRKVELYDGWTGWSWATYPETLRVVYSGFHRYRFGICMTPDDQDKLADIITELAKQYL